MTEQIFFQVIISLFLIWCLLFVIFVVWRSAIVDGYRQALFDARDGLFDQGLQNKIAFSHPAYIYVRDTVNQHIRFSHQHSVWMLIYAGYAYFRYRDLVDKQVETNWNSLTADLDAPTKEMLEKTRQDVGNIFLKYIWFLSPELLPIVVVGVVLVFVFALVGIPILTIREFLIDSNERAIDLKLCNL